MAHPPAEGPALDHTGSDAARIGAILAADPVRWRLLGVVAALDLPDCWIAAGFVRNAIWDHLHGRAASLAGDIDVIRFDRRSSDPADDRAIEAALRRAEPAYDWSVKNQARMHRRNGDAPYRSATDAMRYWPETATAVAARRVGAADCEIAAPFGTADLFDLVLRPTPRFQGEKRRIHEERIRGKGWLQAWPRLLQREP